MFKAAASRTREGATQAAINSSTPDSRAKIQLNNRRFTVSATQNSTGNQETFSPQKPIRHNFRLWNRAELKLGAPNAHQRDKINTVPRHTTTQHLVNLWPLEVGFYTAHLIRNVNGVYFDSLFKNGFFIACRSRAGIWFQFPWGLAGSLFSS